MSRYHPNRREAHTQKEDAIVAEGKPHGLQHAGFLALDSLRKGFNSTILAYGQTGSGKTFSMEGAKDKATGQYTSRGLIPRIFENVFT